MHDYPLTKPMQFERDVHCINIGNFSQREILKDFVWGKLTTLRTDF